MQSERYWKSEPVLLLAAGMMISLSLGMLLALGLRSLQPDLRPSEQRFYSFLISTVSFQLVGLVLVHFFIRQHELGWREFLGVNGPRLRGALVLAMAVVVLALPFILAFNELMRILITRFHSAPEMQPTMQILEMSVSLPQRICFGITAIVLAPLVEEILFRGILYRMIQQRGYPKTALFGTALLFGVIHGSLMTLLPLAALAIILSLLYDKTRNLMAPIAAHSVFNAVNFFTYVYRDELTRWWSQLTP